MSSFFSKKREEFLKPNYENNAFSALGHAVLNQMSGEEKNYSFPLKNYALDYVKHQIPEPVDDAIIIIADSMGYKNILDSNTFTTEIENNEVLVLDSVFPTITATIMSSLTHLVPPSIHELVGYCIYNPKINNVFNSLNLRTEIEGKFIHIEHLGLKKDDVIKGKSIPTLFKEILSNNGETGEFYVYIPEELDSDGIGRYLYQDNKTITYDYNNPLEIVSKISSIIDRKKSNNNKTIHSIYLPHPDTNSHLFGNNSSEYRESLKLVEKIFNTIRKSVPKNTPVLLTSDHGQINLPKHNTEQRVLLSEKQYNNFKENDVLIGYSGRTFHFYYDPDNSQSINTVEEFLEKYDLYGDNGISLSPKESLELIGPVINKNKSALISKLGEKVVVFSKNFYIDHRSVADLSTTEHLVAQHGGLTKEEIKVPFIIWNSQR